MSEMYIGLMIHIWVEKNDTAQFLWEARGASGYSVHSSVLASGLCCKWQEAQSIREGLQWGPIVSLFTPTNSAPCWLENIFFPLVRPGRDFRLLLTVYQKPVLYTKPLFYWLIEFRAEERTGSNHPFHITWWYLSLNIHRMKLTFHRK